ncbi:tyrosine-type recombinase/integrase [Altererythrobacter salegens]|uniref:Tyrosine-type recombinase/integrase n=1 Tax=Croceibacterium salegens TaxID=1737568 RepID=A0A6I4SQR3_9SPHN|nr:site-specific integrase [Croceibacterium salegens]MXO58164.1 tyrosine-type recombinase/integrase [Croceibacterium salegens]
MNKPTGPHAEKRLTAMQVKTIAKRGFYGDGHGLYLKVEASGAKRWVQRLTVNGKRRDIGLGSASLVSLAEARERALEQRKVARGGGDPLAEKRRQEALLTFEEAAREVYRISEPTWRNGKHTKQWIRSLEVYAFPKLGDKKVSIIDSADILAVLTPIWTANPETARRVKQRIGTVLKWAIAQGWRSDNPADAISRALPKHDRSTVKHHKALPYSEVRHALAVIKESDATDTSKLALEFLVLTATRSSETRLARWSEIDLRSATWTIPSERMKAKKSHRVPLSPKALEILNSAISYRLKEADWIFPGPTGKPMSDSTFSKLLRELRVGCVPHGFRASFRMWASEQTNHAREVVEFALAHVIKDKAEAAYARSDLLEKRRSIMNEWSEYIIE